MKQSHAGSSKQALAILQGLKADVVTYNQVTDVQILHAQGSRSRPTGSRACRIIARRSTPPWASWCVRVTRRISTISYLVRSDVKLIFPNPNVG
ncbi:hypothetical protein ACLBOM_12730 [Escherichia coli]